MTQQFQSEAKLTFWTLEVPDMFFNAFSGFYWWLAHIGGAPDKQEKPDLTDFHFGCDPQYSQKMQCIGRTETFFIFIIQAELCTCFLIRSFNKEN